MTQHARRPNSQRGESVDLLRLQAGDDDDHHDGADDDNADNDNADNDNADNDNAMIIY